MAFVIGSLCAGLLLVAGIFTIWRRVRRRAQVEFIRNVLRANSQDTAAVTQKVIASFSTLPDRIGNLEPTIRSILQQSRAFDEIVLVLPDFSERQQKSYSIPEYLKQLPQISILRCGKDWGPATKFIPIVQRELAAGRGHSLIMVIDDDRIYPPDALETYLHFHTLLPDAALAFRGAPMPQGLKWTKPKLCLGANLRAPKKVAVMMGCGSYFIQPRFFDKRLWDYSDAPAAAFFMDDIWISGWLDRRGVKKYVVPTSAMMETAQSQRDTMTLDEVPNGRRWSNNQVIQYFGDSWNVFIPG